MRSIVIFFVLLACALPCHAQLTLNPGDRYVFSFSELPDTQIGQFGFSPSGGVSFHLSEFESGTDQLLFHIFEETPDNPYVAGGIAEAAVDGTAMPDAFSDFDGGVFFEMLAGSVTLLDVTFFFQQPIDDTQSRRYTKTIVPIPEPTSAMILFTGLLHILTGRVSPVPAARRSTRPALRVARVAAPAACAASRQGA
jgi:hypothetical protein